MEDLLGNLSQALRGITCVYTRVLQSPFKLVCEQEANSLSGARSNPHPALKPPEGHKLLQKRWLGFLPAASGCHPTDVHANVHTGFIPVDVS